MTRRKRDIGAELIEAAEEALAFAKGEPTGALIVDVQGDSDAADLNDYLANPTEGLPESVVRAIVLDGISPIRAVREHRGMTRAALAAAAGTSPAYLSRIERGERHAGRKLATRIAEALRVPADMLD